MAVLPSSQASYWLQWPMTREILQIAPSILWSEHSLESPVPGESTTCLGSYRMQCFSIDAAGVRKEAKGTLRHTGMGQLSPSYLGACDMSGQD